MLSKNNQLYWIDPLQKEREQDCIHVAHSQLYLLYHLKSYTLIL